MYDKQSVSTFDIDATMNPLFEEYTMDFDITGFMNDAAIHTGVPVGRKSGGFEVPIPSLVNFLCNPDAM